MEHFDKKDVIQAILIADNNVENFRPLSDNNSTVSMIYRGVFLLILNTLAGTYSFG